MMMILIIFIIEKMMMIINIIFFIIFFSFFSSSSFVIIFLIILNGRRDEIIYSSIAWRWRTEEEPCPNINTRYTWYRYQISTVRERSNITIKSPPLF
jgi:hypothetical protein